jgi:hypothetical protein
VNYYLLNIRWEAIKSLEKRDSVRDAIVWARWESGARRKPVANTHPSNQSQFPPSHPPRRTGTAVGEGGALWQANIQCRVSLYPAGTYTGSLYL